MKTFTKIFATILVLGAGMFAGTQSASANCYRGNCWGAVAMNPNTNAWAYSYNNGSRAIAKRAALARCRGRCTRVLSFKNSCGAYAAGYRGWGWGTSRNKQVALNRALYECRRRSQGCRIRVWACTTR